MNKHLKKQALLQKQALEVIEMLDFKTVLSRFGEYRLVGSVKYGLMTWRDIDVDMIMNNDRYEGDFWEIVSILFRSAKVKQLTLADNRDKREGNRPRSMYIGIKHLDGRGNVWKIDLRLVARDEVTTDKTTKLLYEKMTEETKEVILEIKTQLHGNPKYRKMFSSVDIYEAVLLEGVRSLSDFETYLHASGKSL